MSLIEEEYFEPPVTVSRTSVSLAGTHMGLGKHLSSSLSVSPFLPRFLFDKPRTTNDNTTTNNTNVSHIQSVTSSECASEKTIENESDEETLTPSTDSLSISHDPHLLITQPRDDNVSLPANTARRDDTHIGSWIHVQSEEDGYAIPQCPCSSKSVHAKRVVLSDEEGFDVWESVEAAGRVGPGWAGRWSSAVARSGRVNVEFVEAGVCVR
ncbi:hypothetical protein BC832DRAFT_563538 [Gaertneriomyces semiglobifer]|nr:hypothetical protein BC832DRAFT_563538 [Gaertneriomyces semiglobifer]